MGEVSKLSSPSSSDKIFRKHRHLVPEIRSFEKKLWPITFLLVNKITSPLSGVSVDFNALFRLTISCFFLELFAKNREIANSNRSFSALKF